VFKEVTTSYVDEIDPEKFMEAGIHGMLGTLDPYTVYIDKDNGDEVDLLTSGKYGGIGVTIGLRDGAVRVISVMDGYSAHRQGVVPGDRFLEIGGTKVSGLKPDEIRNLTRGEPGSEVKVLIERDGESEPLEFVLIREEIQVKNITYSGMIEDGIGYIRLERFSRRAGDELRMAIKDLKLSGEVRGLVLDLRGNPGGLLDAAVDVVSKFVPAAAWWSVPAAGAWNPIRDIPPPKSPSCHRCRWWCLPTETARAQARSSPAACRIWTGPSSWEPGRSERDWCKRSCL